MELKNLFTFELTIDKRLKITYNGSDPKTIGLTLVLRNGEKLHSHVHTFFCKNHWFEPGFDYKGCTHLQFFDIKNQKELFNWLLPSELTQGVDKQKIIGVGLNKTGTTSFEHDLQNFGYDFPPTSHGALKILGDVFHGDYYSMYSALNNPRFTAFQDIPYSLPNVYKKIYENRPNDLYVLTVRQNVDKWVNSVLNYYEWIIRGKNINGNNDMYDYISGFEKTTYSNFNVPIFKIWGLKNLNNLEVNLRDVYNQHNNNVVDFFEKNNPKNFILIDVSKKGELQKLTNWLGIKNKKQDFTWENRKI